MMRKIKNNVLLLLLGSILILSACRKDKNCTKGNKVISTLEVSEDLFSSITISGDYFQVYAHRGDSNPNIIFTGESNILPLINPMVHSNHLDIIPLEDVCIEPTTDIIFDIYSPGLKSIGIFGNSSFTTDTILSDYFSIYLSGRGKISTIVFSDSFNIKAFSNGQIELKGEASEGYLILSDNVLIFSYSHQFDTCYINLADAAVAYVNVRNYLNVKINGTGFVYYTGDPVVDKTIIGSGQVIKQ